MKFIAELHQGGGCDSAIGCGTEVIHKDSLKDAMDTVLETP